jgi:hypothetical protein
VQIHGIDIDFIQVFIFLVVGRGELFSFLNKDLLALGFCPLGIEVFPRAMPEWGEEDKS